MNKIILVAAYLLLGELLTLKAAKKHGAED